MSNFLDRLGRMSARHHWRVLAGWIIGVVVLVIAVGQVGGKPVDNFRLPHSDAQRALDILQRNFPTEAGSRAYVVFHVPNGRVSDPGWAGTIADTVGRVQQLRDVTGVSDPLAPGAVSADGSIARAEVLYASSTVDVGRDGYTRLRDALSPARHAGVQVEIGGPLATWEQSTGSTEWIGVLVAMVVLTVVFGSLLAMLLPLGLALVALVTGQLLLALLSGVLDIPSSTPQLVVMIGLGVALDYSLFIVSRYLDRIRAGTAPDAAAGHAAATAGVAVLFAGSTVIIAICGLVVSGIWAVAVMGFAVAIVVAVTVVAALTLLPALLGLLGQHARTSRFHVLARSAAHEYRGARRWANTVVRHPVVATVGALIVLVALAAPVFALRLGQTDAGTAPPSTSQRRAFDLLARGFGPGFNGPLLLVAEGPGVARPDTVVALTSAIGAERGVAAVSPVRLNAARTVAVFQAFPASSPHADTTAQLVRRLRGHVIPQHSAPDIHVLVSGQTAGFVDMAHRMQARLPALIAAVVLVSFIVLTVGFRSLVVPLKAAVMNVLSIGVGYGVIVAVFQWGWGKGLIGLRETVPIVSWVPLLMFAILFGLSMDYEVFLISAIRDAHRRTNDTRPAVVEGLSSTARVISAAAVIMLSVFGAFVFFPDPVVKMVGLGLAVSILVDATIVRMALVPAAMVLLGDANWWLPGWLDRILPTIDFEGEAAAPLAVCRPDQEPVEMPTVPVTVAAETGRSDDELVGGSRGARP